MAQPGLLQPALALSERLLTNMLLKKVLGLGGGGKGDHKGGGAGPVGGYILGTGGLVSSDTYSQIKNKCGAGQQAHHIIPDTLARTSNRAQGSKGVGRIPGMAGFGAGLRFVCKAMPKPKVPNTTQRISATTRSAKQQSAQTTDCLERFR